MHYKQSMNNLNNEIKINQGKILIQVISIKIRHQIFLKKSTSKPFQVSIVNKKY